MKIVQAPKPVLSKIAKPVGKIDKAVKKLLKDMEHALISQTDPEGVGLAAPQVGSSLQVFIVRQDHQAQMLTFINPAIEKLIRKPHDKPSDIKQNSKTTKAKKKAKIEKGVQLEGCLSLKDIWGVVKRPYGVVLSYQDATGKKHTKTFEGFLATIIQHEIDHLNGILFPKRVLEQKNQLFKSVKNAKGEVEFEELAI